LALVPKIYNGSRHPDHAHLNRKVLFQDHYFMLVTCVQNLTTIPSTVPEMKLGSSKFEVGHNLVGLVLGG